RWRSGRPSGSSPRGPLRCVRMSWQRPSCPGSAVPSRASTDPEGGAPLASAGMRDLFDDFLEELRRREAIARGEDPGPERPPQSSQDRPDPDDADDKPDGHDADDQAPTAREDDSEA